VILYHSPHGIGNLLVLLPIFLLLNYISMRYISWMSLLVLPHWYIMRLFFVYFVIFVEPYLSLYSSPLDFPHSSGLLRCLLGWWYWHSFHHWFLYFSWIFSYFCLVDYRTMVGISMELKWLRDLLRNMNVLVPLHIPLYCDNKSIISPATNLVSLANQVYFGWLSCDLSGIHR